MRRTKGKSGKSRVAFASAVLGSLLLCGCGQSQELNILGAYFPVWLLAMIIGVAVAFACRFVLARFRLEPYLGPLVLFYLCIVVSVSCLVWLLLT